MRYLAQRLKSFRFALNGIRELWRKEPNARIHFSILGLVLIAGFFLHISTPEWILIIIVSGGVIMAEMFNTAVEKLADYIQPDQEERIKIIKDISAGAVFISALTSVITGILIFVPRLLSFIGY